MPTLETLKLALLALAIGAALVLPQHAPQRGEPRGWERASPVEVWPMQADHAAESWRPAMLG